MNSLLVQLDNAGLLKGENADLRGLKRLSKKRILNLIHEANELTSAAQLPRDESIFSQSATLSLSGGRLPCGTLDCRSATARNLAQYAALYADRVYIHNFLADHVTSHHDADEEDLKAAVYDDLVLIGALRPLIEAGRIVPITFSEEFCPRCFTLHEPGRALEQRSKDVRHWLRKSFLENTEVQFERCGDEFAYVISGSPWLVEHGLEVYIKKDFPEELKGMRRLQQRIGRGERVSLSNSAIERSKIHDDFVSFIFRNVLFELACSQSLGTTFLTERQLDIDTLNRFSEDTELVNRNRIIQKHLTVLVPFVSTARLGDLLALREGEGGSFLLFREALTRAVENYRSNLNRPFRSKDAMQLYGDVIEPGLTKVDQAVKVARRRLLKGSGARILALGGAISFGVYTGLIPSDLAQAAKALGLVKILADLGAPLLDWRSIKEGVATDDMYFLWRVREETQRQNRQMLG